MTINIIQTITNILDENHQVLKSLTTETYMLYPAPGKAIQNTVTGKVYTTSVNIGAKANLKDYIELDL